MKINQKSVAFPAIAIVVLLLAFTSYLVFQKFQPNKNLSAISQPTPRVSMPTPTPTMDPTENWRIYTSQKYKYEFRYPSGIRLSDQSDQYVAVSYMGEKQKSSGRTQTELFDGYAFNVADVTEGGYGDLDDFFIQKVNQLKDVCTSVGDPRETSISGRRAITHKLSCLGDYDTYYVLNGDTYMEISLLYVGDAEDLPEYTEIVNQIFSTFRFWE